MNINTRKQRAIRILAIFMLVSCAFSFSAKSQTKVVLDTLDNRHQQCLDSGYHMLDCSSHFYDEMDSMLNVVYKGIRSKLDNAGKEQLKSKQQAWLKQRDKHFHVLYSEAQASGVTGSDVHMVYFNKAAYYVRKRVEELIKLYGDPL